MNQHPTPGSGRGGETPGGGPEDPTRHIPRVRGADSSAGGPGGPAAPASAAGGAGGPGAPGGPDAPDDAPTGDAAGADGGDRPTRRRRSGSDRNVTVLVAVAAVVALASAVTAGAAVTIAAQSHAHEQESRDRVAEIVAAMQEQTGRVAVPGTASSKGDPPKKAGATSSAAPAPSARGGGSASAGGGAAAGGAAAGGAAAGGAAAGGGAPAPQAPAEDGAPAPAEGDDAAAPAPADDAAPVDDGGAGEIPVPSAQELLDATMAASDANLSPEERTAWTVDGPVTSNTLSQVADVRAKAAPPPGQEAKGIGSPSFEMKDVVANGDTATATLVLVFPGEWGSWTYPGSTFRYIDGQWKLEKASVCNLAKMAWVSCY